MAGCGGRMISRPFVLPLSLCCSRLCTLRDMRSRSLILPRNLPLPYSQELFRSRGISAKRYLVRCYCHVFYTNQASLRWSRPETDIPISVGPVFALTSCSQVTILATMSSEPTMDNTAIFPQACVNFNSPISADLSGSLILLTTDHEASVS